MPAGQPPESIKRGDAIMLCLLNEAPGTVDKIDPKTATSQFTPPSHWKCFDAADIDGWDCPATRWIIEDIIAEGTLNVVAAASQTGKSLLWLYICTKVLKSGNLFDTFIINPVNRVLYLALEDPVRRIKDRLKEITGSGSIDPGKFKIYTASDLNLANASQFSWLESYIKENKRDFVVLDTYQKATPGLDSYKDEEQSKILHRLANITRKLNVTIVVLDHVRKPKNSQLNRRISLDDIKGTGSKAQNADSVILMQRRGQRLTVATISKDSDRQHHFQLDVNERGKPGEKFAYAGNADTAKDGTAGKKENTRIVQAGFEKLGKASIPDVAKATDLSVATVGRSVKSLVKKDCLKKFGKGRNTKYEYINQEETVN
jgi:hypothetical protein